MTPYQISSEIYGGFYYPGITLRLPYTLPKVSHIQAMFYCKYLKLLYQIKAYGDGCITYFSIITQVIIEILALSFAENGVIFHFSIYTLSDLGVLSNLIGSLSLANEHYSPPTE